MNIADYWLCNCGTGTLTTKHGQIVQHTLQKQLFWHTPAPFQDKAGGEEERKSESLRTN